MYGAQHRINTIHTERNMTIKSLPVLFRPRLLIFFCVFPPSPFANLLLLLAVAGYKQRADVGGPVYVTLTAGMAAEVKTKNRIEKEMAHLDNLVHGLHIACVHIVTIFMGIKKRKHWKPPPEDFFRHKLFPPLCNSFFFPFLLLLLLLKRKMASIIRIVSSYFLPLTKQK